MKDKEKLLEIRKELKKKKPDFIRQDAHKKKSLGYKWKKPKGLQSKLRLHKAGHRKNVTKGYKSPADVKGLTKDGMIPVLVYNVFQLEAIDNKFQVAIISSEVGMKKKLEIMKKAAEKSIVIKNVKDSKKFIEKNENEFRERQEMKKKKTAEEKKKEEKKDKKTIDKIAKDETKQDLTDEEKKDKEKKEFDKLLTQKGGQL